MVNVHLVTQSYQRAVARYVAEEWHEGSTLGVQWATLYVAYGGALRVINRPNSVTLVDTGASA